MRRIIPWQSLDYIARYGSATHTHVVIGLLRCTSPVTGKIKVTLDELADATTLSRKTVQRSISWLETHRIVSSERLPGYRGKVYVIHPRVVTHDHPGWSPMTTLTPSDLGKCDPLTSIVPLEYGSNGNYHEKDRGTTSLYPSPAVNNVHNEESGTFDPVILGSDPTSPVRDESPRTKKKAISPAVDILEFWNLTARRLGATPVINQKDRIIFLTQAKRLIAGGLTGFSLKSMISDFFQRDSHREHRTPHLVFFSKDIQRTLMSGRDVVVDDEVMGWVAGGFGHGDKLPWSEEFCHAFQSIVLRRGLAVVYRYPELVTSIARAADGNIDTAKTLVTQAAALVDAHLNGSIEESARISATLTGGGVILPPDLAAGRMSRQEASTLQEAVLVARTYV